MAARGSTEKELVTKLLLKIFKNSFVNDKEIRIPVMSSDGEEIQIKVTLTAAKTNIDRNGNAESVDVPTDAGKFVEVAQFSDEEKAALAEKLSRIIDIDYTPVPKMMNFSTRTDEEVPF